MTADATNYFVTPVDPEGFSAILPPSKFRVIDFSALEFSTMQRAIIEYVRTYYRDQFNDFVAANGFMMTAEVMCYLSSLLSQRGDILINDAFLPTANSNDAVRNHLTLIGQSMRRQTPATTEIECSVDRSVATDIKIPAGFQFHLVGPDGSPLTYELFSAPYDWSSSIVIPSRKRGVVGWGIEGSFGTDVVVVSAGGPSQKVFVSEVNILDEPIIVTVDGVTWGRVQIIEQSEANDLVFQVVYADDGAEVQFGDNVTGKEPLSGQEIRVRYRVGGGQRGRIGTRYINTRSTFSPEPPATAGVEVNFRNIVPSNGGYDAESIEDAKKRGPRDWATHNAAVSGSDYSHLAATFRHPVYGGVAKAVATVHTSINANIVKVHILAEGDGGLPVKPNQGLKTGLRTYFREINVLTDDVEVEDASIKPVDVSATVVVSRSSDAATIKEKVNSAITSFFDLSKWQLGQALYVSDLYELLAGIDGVRYVNIFAPADDILPTKDVGTGINTVHFDELITLGSKDVKIFYEKSS